MIAGFILARCSAGREQGIATSLTEDSLLLAPPDEATRNDVICVLGNLLENAMEAIGDGATREISLGLWQEDGLLYLRVEDSGAGIDPACAERIFSKGYSTKGANRGYGLYHVRRCIEARGGRIDAATSEWGGAVFSASLRYA